MPDRVSACEMKYLTNVEMKYLTNAARHRQTIQGGGCAVDKRARWLQRMLDNGVEVVVAVRKDGVPPWCRRICRLHHDLGYWDTGAGCCVCVHASKKPVAPQPLGVQVLQIQGPLGFALLSEGNENCAGAPLAPSPSVAQT